MGLRWLVRKSLQFAKPYWKEQFWIVALWTIMIVMSAQIPFIQSMLIDSLSGGSKTEFLLNLAVILVVIYTLLSILNFISEYRLQYLQKKIVRDLWERSYGKLQEVPLKESRDETTGSYMAKVISDTDFVGTAIISFPSLTLNIMRICVYSFVLLLLSPQLALIALISLPLYFVIFHRYSGALAESSSKEREAYSNVLESLREKTEGLQSIKAALREEYFRRLFSADAAKWLQNIKRVMWYSRIYITTYEYFTTLVPLVILAIGAYNVYLGLLSVGTLVAFFLFVRSFYEPLSNTAGTLGFLAQAIPPTERVFGLLERNTSEEEGNAKLEKVDQIQYDSVSFSYEANKPVLDGFNLLLTKGMSISLVGKSGAGKSTAVEMLVRFLDTMKGQILINVKNIRDFKIASVRDKIALVSEDELIFNMSVKDNILLGRSSQEKYLSQVMRLCGLEEFLGKNNYSVGQRGLSLSQGQRQRVALARAVIRKPEVLIMDEAMSALDTEREASIFSAVREYLKGSIIIMIAHRLSTIRLADRIAVLSDGKVVCIGDHEELMRKCDAYQQLVNRQLISSD